MADSTNDDMNAGVRRRGFIGRLPELLAAGALLSLLAGKSKAGTTKTAATGPSDRTSGTMGSESFIGEIIMFAGDYAPYGWALCDGSLKLITQNSALYSVLGTTYGGDGKTTFGLPDLRGRIPIGMGQGSGLPNFTIGQKGGEAAHALTQTEMPSHSHTLAFSSSIGTSSSPSNMVPALDAEGVRHYHNSTPDTTMHSNAIAVAGQSVPHNNMQPCLSINFIICLSGYFPPRS